MWPMEETSRNAQEEVRLEEEERRLVVEEKRKRRSQLVALATQTGLWGCVCLSFVMLYFALYPICTPVLLSKSLIFRFCFYFDILKCFGVVVSSGRGHPDSANGL